MERNLVEVVAVASHLLSQVGHWLLQQVPQGLQVQQVPQGLQVQQVPQGLEAQEALQVCCWLPVLRLQAY